MLAHALRGTLESFVSAHLHEAVCQPSAAQGHMITMWKLIFCHCLHAGGNLMGCLLNGPLGPLIGCPCSHACQVSASN